MVRAGRPSLGKGIFKCTKTDQGSLGVAIWEAKDGFETEVDDDHGAGHSKVKCWSGFPLGPPYPLPSCLSPTFPLVLCCIGPRMPSNPCSRNNRSLLTSVVEKPYDEELSCAF